MLDAEETAGRYLSGPELLTSPQSVTALDRVMQSVDTAGSLMRVCLGGQEMDPTAIFGRVVLTPLMVGFAGWLHDRAKATGTTTLCFLSREGRLMKDVFDILYPRAASGIETKYLYASRRLVQLA